MGIRRSNLTPDYRWNETAGQYINAAGRFVPRAEVRLALDGFLEGATNEARALAEQLRAGQVSLAEWQTAMMRQVKQVHLAAAAAEQGGWAQLTQADYGRVGQVVRAQYGYLDDFAGEIASGRQRLDGTLARRAQLYTQAGRGTFHQFERLSMLAQGVGQERRRLAPADHCQDCVEYAAQGWQAIGSLPPIGDSQCRQNCLCTFEYRAMQSGG